MILMGDPRRRASDSFNAVTKNPAKNDGGILKRPEHLLLTAYANRIQLYCEAGDPVCDYPGINAISHSIYSQYYGDAAKFVLDKIGG